MMGTIRISWKDELGVPHTYELEEVQYTPKGNVNVISVCCLGDMLGKG
jgi:hypothetical protein